MSDLDSLDAILALPDDGEFLARFVDQHADLLAVLRAHAEEHGKAKGGLTLKLDYDVERRGVVALKAEVAFREPKAPAAKAVAWIGRDNALTASNPNQMKLPLRDAGTPRDLRSVDGRPG